MIELLDCTLRDGGYINNWKFGKQNIIEIIKGLINANIDIIECGFLKSKAYNADYSLFDTVGRIVDIIPNASKLVCMVNYGEYDINDIPYVSNSMIYGIRVAFHKKDKKDALEYCYKLKNKGYRVFVQAMVTTAYNQDELYDLIREIDELMPYAFYIVDSYGTMKPNDITNLSKIIHYRLDTDIKLGLHSHNNLQLSFANAIKFIDEYKYIPRDIIIDSSIMGMGRGAGNLTTELIASYLNGYKLEQILEIADKYINPLTSKYKWGYSMPYFLSGVNNYHPNIVSEFVENNLSAKEINKILTKGWCKNE
jgi:4-hydroxy 2-oxovalerate aldolase